MFQRQKNWISDVLWKPKKAHSLEQLRYLHYVLIKNSTVNETNRGLLVETLRSIAEILIWGDQNDSRVFDFFLEKSMLLYFLKMMSQKSNQICVQLLQTLSILFENIRNETSLYYLLSNNNVNSIIIHKFDFSDEEVLAYYISFLKTLSLKLNRHTVHFFFNEHKNDFPLYTEAIKFFNHSESMVRIAVRTLTLNVYRVGDKNMLNFIRDKTADPYFWNLVWFIGNHAIELDNCVQKESHHLKCDRLKDLVAEHLDHLHYLHDILSLDIQDVNDVLTGHLINRLLIPLYIYSLVKDRPNMEQDTPRLGAMVSLFLLSQILLIMSHPPLVSSLVDVLVNGDEVGTPEDSPLPLRKACSVTNSMASIRTFQRPEETLEESLVARGVNTEGYSFLGKSAALGTLNRGRSLHVANSKFYVKGKGATIPEKRQNTRMQASDLSPVQVPLMQTPLGQTDSESDTDSSSSYSTPPATSGESTNEEATTETRTLHTQNSLAEDENSETESIKSAIKRPKDFQRDSMFMEAIQDSLDCSTHDKEALFSICLLYAALCNKGVDKSLLESIGISSAQVKVPYNEKVVENLIRVLELGYRNGSQVRVVTLEMLIILLKEIVMHTVENKRYSYLNDRHLAMIENVREASTLQLRHYYKEDEIFLDMFEDEYRQSKVKPLNLQHFMMDAALLLPPTGTPLTGIEFYKRLPCGEVEHTRRAIRVFLLMRDLCLALLGQSEKSLPLSKIENSVNLEDVLDLNNSDLIACTVRLEEKQQRRFLVIDEAQFILVEPDTTKLGWGVVKFVARLQDVETAPDKEDSRSLFITIHQPSSVRSLTKVRSRPILSAKFIFDDYIRCMSAKQRLQRRRGMLRQHKLHCIAQLLELPAMASPPSHYYSITPPAYVNLGPGQLDSPTDSQTSESVEERSGQQRQSFELPQLPSDAPKESLSSVQTPLASAMATPEQCLSPVHCQGRRTTSQAEALAKVLEQSPPDNKVPTAPKPRACSLEDATEAIELQHTNGDSDTVVRTTPFDINSRSRSHSMENIPRPGFINKPLSQSAPATPRGDRRALSISFEDEETTVRVNSMSEPAIFLSSQWDSPSAHAQHPEKKTKKTRGKKAKGKTRQRKK
ncbi:protein CLEC16A-like isoform X2 [Acropora palmata]|uniref:protein CLEC16A-like isoform X2 n=1 Tax=Acropora palmata TaxID=6131 RepID=UPI003DA19C35